MIGFYASDIRGVADDDTFHAEAGQYDAEFYFNRQCASVALRIAIDLDTTAARPDR